MTLNKNITNLEIADLLRSVAAAYQIENASGNRFQIIAYQKAADAVEHLSSEAKDVWEEGKLTDVSGIGPSISSHLGEIFTKGKSKHFEEVLGEIPPAVFELIKVPGIGPKTASRLVRELKIPNKNPLSDLKVKALKGMVAPLEDFGKKSEQEIIQNISEFEQKPKERLLLPRALTLAGEVIAWMRQDKSIEAIEALGSARRRASTVGDIDLGVATKSPEKAMDRFVKYPNAVRTIEKGAVTSSILLPGNIQVDLLVIHPDSWGSALQHFTGSKHHNIALREYALKKNVSLSERGIKSLKTNKLSKFKTEVAFYKRLKMNYIAPELREDMGEIQAAVGNKLPTLVELGDVKGDLQIHSDFDIETSHDLGASSMKEIATKAASLGYEYVALTDHNPSQKGHNERNIYKLIEARSNQIVQINEFVKKTMKNSIPKLYNSLEIDIKPDGTLPVPDKAMQLLDFALVSIHSDFSSDRTRQTKRVMSALSHPKVKIFAHPTGRKINHREGVELDWPKIFDFALAHNKWIEINCDPMRLDLPDFLVKEAVLAGIMLTLGTDSHHIDSMDNMRWGVNVARRGWTEAANIANTRPLAEFEKLLMKGL